MIKNFFVGMINFIREVFSDSGQASSSRVMAMVALIWYLRWCRHIVYKTNQIPDLTNGLILVGGLYGINRLSSILELYFSNKAGVQVQPVRTEVTATQTSVTATKTS